MQTRPFEAIQPQSIPSAATDPAGANTAPTGSPSSGQGQAPGSSAINAPSHAAQAATQPVGGSFATGTKVPSQVAARGLGRSLREPSSAINGPAAPAPTIVVGTPSARHSSALAGLGEAIRAANTGTGAVPPPKPNILPNGWNYDTGEFLGEGISEEDLDRYANFEANRTGGASVPMGFTAAPTNGRAQPSAILPVRPVPGVAPAQAPRPVNPFPVEPRPMVPTTQTRPAATGGGAHAASGRSLSAPSPAVNGPSPRQAGPQPGQVGPKPQAVGPQPRALQKIRQAITARRLNAQARKAAKIQALPAPSKPFYKPGQRPPRVSYPQRQPYPDEIKYADVYAHYDAYDAWRAKKKHRAKKRRHTLLTVLLVGLSLLITTGAAADVPTAVASQSELSMADFNIYQSGHQLLEIDDALNGAFWYSYAESYNLDPALIETARGLQIGDSDTKALEAYGHLTAWVQYQTGHSTNYLPETGYQTWAQSTQYTMDYLVTFRAFTVNGKTETDEAKIAALYANPANSKTLREYGVSLQIENGVVADIECYTHELA